jgi:hypothetical protein
MRRRRGRRRPHQSIAGLRQSQTDLIAIEGRKVLDDLVDAIAIREIFEEDFGLDSGAAEYRAAAENAALADDHRI